ncbi:MAG TPA: 3-deoxy-8-phosphooctulonate synthase [Bacteroidales bacterium]|nr:3-deoxy-8-phosphooctulonate synthase [Bacteroidales bacterium]HPT10588.1 3-deoxy-8-phosphooctulonate synthase [Bacteroidales bacterium]
MFFLIAGPCVVENETMPFEIASHILQITQRLKIPLIFKASYKKANRSRGDSFTGIGDLRGLQLIREVGARLSIPVLTDIHTEAEAEQAAQYVDILQIPAFLCRQTELLVAAGKTGKPVNIKKGQFASAGSMSFAVEKIRKTGNNQVMLTERGNSFGYNDLIVDFCNIPQMQALKVPVIVDVTHSLQIPNQPDGVTGGRPELIDTMACAAIAAGADGIFMETHPDPSRARSDGANMLRLELLENLLEKLVRIKKAINESQPL